MKTHLICSMLSGERAYLKLLFRSWLTPLVGGWTVVCSVRGKEQYLVHDQVTYSGMIGPGHVGTCPPMKVGPRSCQPRSFPTTCSEAALAPLLTFKVLLVDVIVNDVSLIDNEQVRSG